MEKTRKNLIASITAFTAGFFAFLPAPVFALEQVIDNNVSFFGSDSELFIIFFSLLRLAVGILLIYMLGVFAYGHLIVGQTRSSFDRHVVAKKTRKSGLVGAVISLLLLTLDGNLVNSLLQLII